MATVKNTFITIDESPRRRGDRRRLKTEPPPATSFLDDLCCSADNDARSEDGDVHEDHKKIDVRCQPTATELTEVSSPTVSPGARTPWRGGVNSSLPVPSLSQQVSGPFCMPVPNSPRPRLSGQYGCGPSLSYVQQHPEPQQQQQPQPQMVGTQVGVGVPSGTALVFWPVPATLPYGASASGTSVAQGLSKSARPVSMPVQQNPVPLSRPCPPPLPRLLGSEAAVAAVSNAGSGGNGAQPQTVLPSLDADGIFRVRWIVDAKKLRGNDRVVVSPPFDVLAGELGTFRMMLSPAAPDRTRGGATFKNAMGKGKVELKCDTALDRLLTFRIWIGSCAPSGRQEPPRGPVQHNFAISGVCGLPEVQSLWNFASVVDDATKTFFVGAEIC